MLLLIGDRASRGSSWLMRGLPLSGLRLFAVPFGDVDDDSSLLTHFYTHSVTLAAVMVEPVCTQTGATLSKAAARRLQAACAQFGVPIIADETRCGLGRCGALLASAACKLNPDCIILGESLGGGIASVAAVIYDRQARHYYSRHLWKTSHKLAFRSFGVLPLTYRRLQLSIAPLSPPARPTQHV